MKVLHAAAFTAVIACSTVAQAANVSFTGMFTQDDNVQLFNFSLGAAATVSIRTLSYAGGTNAAGSVIPAGGFDPSLTLFSTIGALITQNDDGLGAVDDPRTFAAYDALISRALQPGMYTVSLAQSGNFARGPGLSNGFLRAGQGNYTSGASFDPSCAGATRFCDVSGFSPANQRTGFFAVDFLNVDRASLGAAGGGVAVVPVPAALPLLAAGLGLLGIVGLRRRPG